jgi:hypothetical protein
MPVPSDIAVDQTLMPRAYGNTRGHPRVGRVAAVAGVASIVLAGALAASLGRPAAARAEIPVIGPVIHKIGGIGHTILHPVDAVMEGFLKILQAIFGGIEARLIAGVINALLTIPNFDSGHVAELEQTTVAIAAGMLTAVLTLSILRYYLAGLTDSGSGGFEALQGVVRVIGAVGFIILWPGLFNEVVKIPRLFDEALLGSGSVQHNVALLFDAALALGAGAFALDSGVGLIFVILIGFIAAVTFIALLWMKVLLSVLLMFLYVTMPLAVVLWPVPELSFLAASSMKVLLVALSVPCVWAILFALSAAINADILTWVPTHSVLDTLIVRPLAGLTLMILCITIPRFLMRSAMIGPHSQPRGGRMWRAVTIGMLGARVATGGARAVAGAAAEGNAGAQRMIGALPAAVRPPSKAGEGSVAARVAFGRSGFEKAKDAGGGGVGAKGSAEAGAATPGGAARAGAGSEAADAGAGAGAAGAAQAISRKRDSTSVPGIERPEFDWGAVNKAGKEMHAQSRIAPPDAGAVAAAMATFGAETQRGLAEFNAAHPAKLREFAAQHLHSGSLSDGQRDALMTLGSARGAAVEAGMSQAIGSLDAQTQGQASTEVRPPSPASQTGGESPAARPSAPPPSPGAPPQQPSTSTGTPGPPPAASSRGSGVGQQQQQQPPAPNVIEQPSAPASPPKRGLPNDPPDLEPFLD